MCPHLFFKSPSVIPPRRPNRATFNIGLIHFHCVRQKKVNGSFSGSGSPGRCPWSVRLGYWMKKKIVQLPVIFSRLIKLLSQKKNVHVIGTQTIIQQALTTGVTLLGFLHKKWNCQASSHILIWDQTWVDS